MSTSDVTKKTELSGDELFREGLRIVEDAKRENFTLRITGGIAIFYLVEKTFCYDSMNNLKTSAARVSELMNEPNTQASLQLSAKRTQGLIDQSTKRPSLRTGAKPPKTAPKNSIGRNRRCLAVI